MDNTDSSNPHSEATEAAPLSFLEMLQSTLWAALGVQKRSNRVRDFSRGSATGFILMGIGFTTVFVLCLIGLVNLILSNA